jgi:nucleoside-diphosphate-sugar epimerase
MTRVAVTGGSGFIGSNLVRALVLRGFDVHLLNRVEHSDWRLGAIRGDFNNHQVDLGNSDSVDAVLRAIRPKLLFHLAQYGGYSWQTGVHAMVQTNYLAGINLLHAARNADVEVVVNTGSSSEYGLRSQPTREFDCPEPNSDYAATKVAFTLYCQQWARRNGHKAPTIRLFSVYGPFEEPMRLMPRLLSHGLDGHWPDLVAPDTARDFVFIEDVMDAYMRVATAELSDPGAIYNVCSGQQITIQGAVDLVRSLLDIKTEPVWNTMRGRAWDTRVWCGDPSHAADELGWRATTTLRQGLLRFVDWLQNEPGMREFYRERAESKI